VTEDVINQKMARLMRLLAERLDGYAAGDDLAFETLGEAIEEEDFAPDDLQAAVWMLRRIVEPGFAAASPGTPAGKHAQRVLSAEERATLTPAAWGCLLELQRRGSLTAGQVERVLDLCAESGVRPVDPELARELATRVALLDDRASAGEIANGDIDVIH
jgi:hypothetical protein